MCLTKTLSAMGSRGSKTSKKPVVKPEPERKKKKGKNIPKSPCMKKTTQRRAERLVKQRLKVGDPIVPPGSPAEVVIRDTGNNHWSVPFSSDLYGWTGGRWPSFNLKTVQAWWDEARNGDGDPTWDLD